MAKHNELGKLGEELASKFLEEQGYSILEQNWVFQKAEIDILAQKDDVLAVVEVKTRSSTAFGLPQDFVNPKKIKLLVKAIDAYVQQKGFEGNVRFDIIAITKEKEQQKDCFAIEHLVDAFYYF